MEQTEQLINLIHSLQENVKEQSLDSSAIKKATETFSSIGYKYDANLFPELRKNAEFCSTAKSEPNNLAEALLWKMGKWNIYKDFVNNYNSNGSLTKKTDVVFAAFAKHLKNRANPSYDQHALRAKWAINTNLNSRERAQCKAALIKSKGKEKGKWKANLSGSETITCYNLYVAKLNDLSSKGLSKSALDKLLMPLGQALKIHCNDYDAFASLCGSGKNG